MYDNRLHDLIHLFVELRAICDRIDRELTHLIVDERYNREERSGVQEKRQKEKVDLDICL